MESDVEKAAKLIATQLKYLGNGNAASEMGAIEGHAVKIVEAAEMIASAIRDLADAIREAQ